MDLTTGSPGAAEAGMAEPARTAAAKPTEIAESRNAPVKGVVAWLNDRSRI